MTWYGGDTGEGDMGNHAMAATSGDEPDREKPAWSAPFLVARGDFFDSFSDGRKIKLNVEITTIPSNKRTSMILLVSPSAKDTAVWPALREIGRNAGANAVP